MATIARVTGIPRDEKRATRLERATFSLEGGECRTETVDTEALASDAADACSNACTGSAGKPAAAELADVLRMLDRLPLTDGERAEAVRRLLRAGEPR